MTKFPSSEETVCNSLLLEAKPILYDLAREMKIDDLSEDFLKEVVVPISLYFDHKFPRRDKPYFICFTGGQGSGKTTLSFLFKNCFQRF